LSVQTAEGLAEYAHGRIRRELGMAVDQGKRYSWGYPSCPDLSQHRLWTTSSTSPPSASASPTGFQFEPEQTTAALVVTHPAARYYALALSGGDGEA
jgi:5-methyltetrahydrofolate--homocysteine methyltransferase